MIKISVTVGICILARIEISPATNPPFLILGRFKFEYMRKLDSISGIKTVFGIRINFKSKHEQT